MKNIVIGLILGTLSFNVIAEPSHVQYYLDGTFSIDFKLIKKRGRYVTYIAKDHNLNGESRPMIEMLDCKKFRVRGWSPKGTISCAWIEGDDIDSCDNNKTKSISTEGSWSGWTSFNLKDAGYMKPPVDSWC